MMGTIAAISEGPQDARHRCDTNAACDEHESAAANAVDRELAVRAVEVDATSLGAIRSAAQ
jgi:hypothetical protein